MLWYNLTSYNTRDFILVGQLLEHVTSTTSILRSCCQRQARQERKRVRRLLCRRRTPWPFGWSEMDGPTDIFLPEERNLIDIQSSQATIVPKRIAFHSDCRCHVELTDCAASHVFLLLLDTQSRDWVPLPLSSPRAFHLDCRSQSDGARTRGRPSPARAVIICQTGV